MVPLPSTLVALTAPLLLSTTVAAYPTCDNFQTGFQCNASISHYWGQYSLWFQVPSHIPTDVPPQCRITFVQVLARHGARDPTASKTSSYNATISALKQNVTSFTGQYAFLKNFTYTLGADQLTQFGQQEMVNSGIEFYKRYRTLTKEFIPFFRSSSEDRVVESAENFTQGYHQARLSDRSPHPRDTDPYNILVIAEADNSNNTLNHETCTNFEDGPDSEIASRAQAEFASVFVPNITARLNSDLPGAQLTTAQTISLLDLCPFTTVASTTGSLGPFCNLFTESEWHSYNYYQTLNKFYGYSYGNPLGPTQGVGFTNELLARLTSTPVQDASSTNHTLDSNNSTFPLGLPLYADFSHDNDITAILSAIGLYNSTIVNPLSNTTVSGAETIGGYSAAWTVPFSARIYFEKMQCSHEPEDEEFIRIIVNDRVVPPTTCGADELGRCRLGRFVESQGFARGRGGWGRCFG